MNAPEPAGVQDAFATQDLIAATAAKVDPTIRSDLRGRLAAALEMALNESEVPASVPLPSVRRFSAQLGVHRNTMRAALEMLAERGLVVRSPAGRYAISDQIRRRPVRAGSAADVDQMIGDAARLAIERGEGRSAFVRAADEAYAALAEGEREEVPTIVLLEPGEPLPGLDAETISGLIGRPVESRSREGLAQLAESNPVILAVPGDREEAEGLVPGAEVLPLGSALDIDIRAGVTSLEPAATVAVIGADGVSADGVARRVLRFRPDLTVETLSGGHSELPAGTDLALVPSDLDLRAIQTPVAAYRTGVTVTEREILLRRLDQWAGPPKADCVSGSRDKASSRTGIASSQTPR